MVNSDILEYDLPAAVSQEQARELAVEQCTFCSDIVYQGVGSLFALVKLLADSSVWYFWWD